MNNSAKRAGVFMQGGGYPVGGCLPPLSPLIAAINVAAVSSATDGAVTLAYGVYPNKVALQLFDREAAEQMTADFANRLRENPIGLPVYAGHPDEPGWSKMNPHADGRAVGRIKEMEPTETGLRLRMVFNDRHAPSFVGYSPYWAMRRASDDGAYRPVKLYSIGLTNRPNIKSAVFPAGQSTPAANAGKKPTLGDFTSAIDEIRMKHGMSACPIVRIEPTERRWQDVIAQLERSAANLSDFVRYNATVGLRDAAQG